MYKPILTAIGIFFIIASYGQNVQTATNGLYHDPTTGTTDRVVGLGGTLTQNTTVDLGSSYIFGLKKGGDNYLYILNDGKTGIGTSSPASSSILDLTTTTKGFLMPRMTTTQKNAISSPAAGLQVYDISLNSPFFYDGTNWQNYNNLNTVGSILSPTSGNGATITGNTIQLHAAGSSTNQSGIVTVGAQSFGGLKTFTAGVIATAGGLRVGPGSVTFTGNGGMALLGTPAYTFYGNGGIARRAALGVDANSDFIYYYNPTALGAFDGTERFRVVGSTGNFLIGTSTDQVSSLLTLSSTTKGFLQPRMTTAQRTTISSPAAGLQVYDTDIKAPFFYDGTNWNRNSNPWLNNSADIYYSSGKVGIGTSTPNTNAELDVNGNIFSNGKIAIGTTDMAKIGTYSLAVNGDAIFNKVKVKVYSGWPDYVFNDNYELPSLTYVEQYIKKHKHLPELPAAGEIEKEGIDVGDNAALLLKKIEELTLYVIELNKKDKELSGKIEELVAENKLLKSKISK